MKVFSFFVFLMGVFWVQENWARYCPTMSPKKCTAQDYRKRYIDSKCSQPQECWDIRCKALEEELETTYRIPRGQISKEPQEACGNKRMSDFFGLNTGRLPKGVDEEEVAHCFVKQRNTNCYEAAKAFVLQEFRKKQPQRDLQKKLYEKQQTIASLQAIQKEVSNFQYTLQHTLPRFISPIPQSLGPALEEVKEALTAQIQTLIIEFKQMRE